MNNHPGINDEETLPMDSAKAKHTPGPWRVYPPGHCVPYYDICPRVVSNKPSGRSLNDEPSDADACLIAAAPDLLRVAEMVSGSLCHIANSMIRMHLETELNAAIAKATGEV